MECVGCKNTSSLPQVMNGAILQQVFVVEYVVLSQMCDDCHRVEAKDFWKAVVQVRQKVKLSIFFYWVVWLVCAEFL